MVRLCWKPSGKGDDGDVKGRIDGLLWYKDSGKHLYGDYSMAVVQANSTLEDHCHLASGDLSSDSLGPKVTFIGVYDGHGGTEASRFVSDNLFNNFKSFAAENKGISETVIRKAFLATEEGFLSLVKKQWLNKPQIASSGSCCLAGIICKNMLYIANAGDSRAVLGRVERETRVTSAIQLSSEHNVNIETERDELRSKHPCDSQVVVMKHKVWRVKGLIQVSRSIGDAYLKKAEFNKAPLPYKFRLYEPFFKPILSCEPTISIHKLTPDDPFIIFASDGLWEQLSNQEAVNIVSNNPHKGIAKQLVKAALRKAAKKREMRFSDLQKIEKGVRRHFHDDITVIVVFLDPEMIYSSLYGPPRSIRDGRIINPYP